MRSVNKKEAAFGFLFFYFSPLHFTNKTIDNVYLRQYFLQHIRRAYIAETFNMQGVIFQ